MRCFFGTSDTIDTSNAAISRDANKTSASVTLLSSYSCSDLTAPKSTSLPWNSQIQMIIMRNVNIAKGTTDPRVEFCLPK